MKSAIRAVVLSTIVFSSVAFAQRSTSEGSGLSEDPSASVMKVGNLDVRGMLDADILLTFVQLGAVGEVGVVPLGPGTLAVGGEIDYGFCFTYCLALSAVSPFGIGQRFFTPMARASYHFTIPALKVAHKLDLFASLGVGLTFASAEVTADDDSFRYAAASTGFAIAPGIGANWFVNPNLFVGAEARYRVASGSFNYTATSGTQQYTFTDDQEAWSLTGLNVNFFLGWRI